MWQALTVLRDARLVSALSTSVAIGCNQLSAADLLDQLRVSGTPPAVIAPLRNGSGEQVTLAFDQYLNASETFVSQVANGGTPTGALTDRGVGPGIDWGFVRTQVDLGVLFGGQFNVAYEGQFNSDSSFNALLGGTRWVF